MSTIYNSAWLLDTKSTDFRTFVSKLSTYIQRIKNKEIYYKISKPIEKGGLGLINIEQRIQAIKIKELLQAEQNRPETDDYTTTTTTTTLE